MTVKHTKRGRIVRDSIKNGKYTLRVVGSEKQGFKLAGQQGENLFPFGQTYKQQTHAVTYGQNKFGLKAVKVAKTPHAKAA